MSVTKETKKRGRPKKAKEVTVAPDTPVNDQSTRDAAAKAVDEILSQASAKASGVETVSPVSIDDARPGASSYDTLDRNQEDYISGTRVKDLQLVPNRAYDEKRGITRRVGLPSEYHYCWVHTDLLTRFRIWGYKFVLYTGGNQSGLAEDGFDGTGIFEKTFDNHVRNGDMFLMWCPIRLYEAVSKEDADFRERMEGAAEDEIHNEGYRRGIRTFKEVNGVTLWN